ncbi:MAG: ABC transporter permease [Stappiaceae bacterium]
MNIHPQASEPKIDAQEVGDNLRLLVSGEWVISHAAQGETLVESVVLSPDVHSITIDLAGITTIDTSGAWLLSRLRGHFEFEGFKVKLVNPSDVSKQLLDAIIGYRQPPWKPEKRAVSLFYFLEAIGRRAEQIGDDVVAALHILGTLAGVISTGVFQPRRLRLVSIGMHFQKMGIEAVPIVVLMSFLIGAIISQQGGFYLKQFGADIFVVDLVGVLVLREIGVLLTAIMIAGRSGSAFTAEIGSMKMREEIDALHVIGMRVAEVLILPRMIALILALPILTFIADISALVGGALVSWAYLGIPPQTFMIQLQAALTLQIILVGIVKAPFMALIIAVIASVEGLKVSGSSESLGRQTTMSVVKAIFMVIVVDGMFAMFFAAIGV